MLNEFEVHRSKVNVTKVKNVKILVFSLVMEKVVKGQGRVSCSKVAMVKFKGCNGQGQRSEGKDTGSRSNLLGEAFYCYCG